MKKGTSSAAALTLVALLAAAGATPARRAEKTRSHELPPGAIVVLGTPANPRGTGERISLDLKDADIRDVLKTFSKLEKFNLAIDPEVKGSVTVCLENVPWDQALDVILRTNGLGYVLEGRILRIATPAKLLDPP
ncbi:MAG TPA: secretin and TonB N-terminal domain-containing protein [Thermoanaerobaculia bacterium]|nr:secretin and TonB N-terminal domain-containing protein [Thermoanaerobaculia bacterium]